MKGFQFRFEQTICDQLVAVAKKLQHTPKEKDLWYEGLYLLGKLNHEEEEEEEKGKKSTPGSTKRTREEQHNELEEEEEEEEEDEEEELELVFSSEGDSLSQSLSDPEDDEEDLEGQVAYALLTYGPKGWDAYLKTQYAKKLFWDQLQVVLNSHTHGRAVFDAMLVHLQDYNMYVSHTKTSFKGKCHLCKTQKDLSVIFHFSGGSWRMGSHCGTLMEAIFKLMIGIWQGDLKRDILHNMNTVLNTHKWA